MRLFISYRRSDSQAISGRLYDHLVAAFGEDSVFIDTEVIPIGVDFRAFLQDEIEKADVILVIIGQRWAEELYQRRKKTDFVLIEIQNALRLRKIVIPILIDGAQMPDNRYLPASLQPIFPYLNAESIDIGGKFYRDVTNLISNLQQFDASAAVSYPEYIELDDNNKTFIRPLVYISTIIVVITIIVASIFLRLQESAQAELANIDTAEATDFVDESLTDTAVVEALPISPTVDNTSTSTTSSIPVMQTPSQIPSSTLSQTPSSTPSASPTLDLLQSALARAQEFDSSTNTDWEPFEWTFDDEHTMVLVPSGCFLFGSISGDADEQPMRERCEDAFWIDKTEVTNEQFGTIGCSETSSAPNQPITCINWFEAREYCEARGGQLPTEPQWEYAASGVENWDYPWGNEWNENYANYRNTRPNETLTVGSYPEGASWVGALDMAGNVWEWTTTAYGYDVNLDYMYSIDGDILYSYPYDPDDGRETYSEDEEYRRVRRGGSFLNTPYVLRTSYHFTVSPYIDENTYGFRCVVPVEE